MARLPGWDGVPAIPSRSISESTPSVPQNRRLKALIRLEIIGPELDCHGFPLTIR
jgi:hypothetical protein